jgi:hypothetical protein
MMDSRELVRSDWQSLGGGDDEIDNLILALEN